MNEKCNRYICIFDFVHYICVFKIIEQIENMNEKRSNTIINEAVMALKGITGRTDISYSIDTGGGYDASITIGPYDFVAIVKPSLTVGTVLLALQQAAEKKNETGKPVILVTKHISPSLGSSLLQEKVNVIDMSGNALIKYRTLFIMVNASANNKKVHNTEPKGNKLSESSIKIIFHLLAMKELANKTIREIADITELSVGSVKNTLDELTARRFLVKTEKGRAIVNRDALIDLWQERYNESLKPKLLLSKFDFRTVDSKKNWSKVKLPVGMSWGGDCGANLLDGYLVPGEYEIYSSSPAPLILTTGHFDKAHIGDVKVYKKFWKSELFDGGTPSLIIYADLMGSGDSRCLDAATRLRSYGI